jgi:hypothetical protein
VRKTARHTERRTESEVESGREQGAVRDAAREGTQGTVFAAEQIERTSGDRDESNPVPVHFQILR